MIKALIVCLLWCEYSAEEVPNDDCKELEAEAWDLKLPAFDKTITVPPLPSDASDYAYATDNALVAVPSECFTEYKDKIKDFADLDDREGGPQNLGYFRITDLEGGYETLAMMKSCARGFFIDLHGSGGPGWDAVQNGIILAGMGYISVLPDSMTMPDDMKLKGELPMKKTSDIDTTNYCGGYSPDTGSCGKFKKPYCYSTRLDNIVNDQSKYRTFVEGVYQIRKREIDYFVDSQADLLAAFTDVYLIGNSEGAMVASRYHHPALDKLLKGRILNSWSCDFNYFVSCKDNARICGDKCSKSVPQLNVIGSNDEYFGAGDESMASKVAAAGGGYGGPITGNCRATYDEQSFTDATVVVLTSAEHGPTYINDNTVRSVYGDFLGHGGKTPSVWPSLTSCTEKTGVWSCPKDGPSTCKDWKVNPEATFDLASDPLPDPTASDVESKFQILDLKGSSASLIPALALLVACGVALHAMALASQRVRKHRNSNDDQAVLLPQEVEDC
jgi:hypothetical protein